MENLVIFEYIQYSNMKLNEYGIFEYTKNGHSLGALTWYLMFLTFFRTVGAEETKSELQHRSAVMDLCSCLSPLSLP